MTEFHVLILIGRQAMGLFGGDVDEAVDGVVEAFLDYMQEYMSA